MNKTLENAGGRTVLVVDDEPLVAMLITDVLEDLGFASLNASDGASGLDELKSASRVDLLITDVGLPGEMNGHRFVDLARQMQPDLRVLFVTGYAETGVLSTDQLAPRTQVLTKPFSIDVLATKVKSLLADL